MPGQWLEGLAAALSFATLAAATTATRRSLGAQIFALVSPRNGIALAATRSPVAPGGTVIAPHAASAVGSRPQPPLVLALPVGFAMPQPILTSLQSTAERTP